MDIGEKKRVIVIPDEEPIEVPNWPIKVEPEVIRVSEKVNNGITR